MMKLKHSSWYVANPRVQVKLAGGSGGDIPLSTGQLTAGLFWFLLWVAVCCCAVWVSPAHAQAISATEGNDVIDSGSTQPFKQVFQQEVEALLQDKPSSVASQARVEVVLGQLDPRLKLAPCSKVKTYVPEGARLWGRTHVGMRCEQGAVPWNVYWPVTVKVWSPAVVAVVPLKPGSIVAAADLRIMEVDLAESTSPAVVNPKDVIGRSVTRLITPGRSLRVDDVRMRRWFASGDPVRVMVQGDGFSATAEGVALSHGDEGQCARIRLDGQRVLCARPVADRLAEVTL